MASYTAILMHGNRSAEGTYRFEAEDGLLSRTPITVLRTFLEWVEEHTPLDHIDYEVNAAMRNKDKGVVTALGSLHFEDDGDQPFVCMISEAE